MFAVGSWFYCDFIWTWLTNSYKCFDGVTRILLAMGLGNLSVGRILENSLFFYNWTASLPSYKGYVCLCLCLSSLLSAFWVVGNFCFLVLSELRVPSDGFSQGPSPVPLHHSLAVLSPMGSSPQEVTLQPSASFAAFGRLSMKIQCSLGETSSGWEWPVSEPRQTGALICHARPYRVFRRFWWFQLVSPSSTMKAFSSFLTFYQRLGVRKIAGILLPTNLV